MLAVTILVAATGLVLGLRFNVFVLALMLLLATTSIFAIGIWGGGNPLVVALNLLATLASVQISYLIGCLIAAQFPTRAKPRAGRRRDTCEDYLRARRCADHSHTVCCEGPDIQWGRVVVVRVN
jgi:hypothetical protein